jgi:hypothetical protein
MGLAESESYFVSPEVHVAAAAELNTPEGKLIEGQIIGSLRFVSSGQEHGYLREAGDSFCFQPMEKELMKTGVANMLRCAEDLSLKVYVAACCTSHQFQAEGPSSSRVLELEDKIASLEQEKLDLQKALEAERIQHAAARTEADAAVELSKTLTDQLAKA